MKTSDFSYDLPEELIAQDPLSDRSSSRLLVLDKTTGEMKDDVFRNIGSYLVPGDLLVRNVTRVIPARLFGVKEETGARIEVLLLTRKSGSDWDVLVKPSRKVKEGTVLSFGGRMTGTILEKGEEGGHVIRFAYDGIFEEILDELGEMPLPPYIHHKLEDRERYQTVYARENGSAAAPTAGLHFTEELLASLRDAGVEIADVTLHVGLGTFRPVKTEDVESHHMHSEFRIVSKETADLVNRARAEGRRVIAVGTTSLRTLESSAGEDGSLRAGSGWTDIFIYPGYRFRVTDALITNFHLPESTLLMLVSALAGRERILAAYEHAVREKYRFFSFGDAMLIR